MKKKAPKRKPNTAKRGDPTAKPKKRAEKKDDWIGRLNGKMRTVGDIESPAVPLEDWEALR
ncbi:MAG: hypothetical protein WCB53_09960 [Terriglobales bacterium]